MRATTERRLRRDVARRAGCEPGRWSLTYCPYCGVVLGVDWKSATEPRFEELTWIDVVTAGGSRRLWVERTGIAAHLDHVIPEWSNGPTSPDNTVVACAPCNLAKGGAVLGTTSFLVWLMQRRSEIAKRLVPQRTEARA